MKTLIPALTPSLDSLSQPLPKRLFSPDSLVFALSVALFLLSLLLVPAA